MILKYVEKAPFFYVALQAAIVFLLLSYKLKKSDYLKAFFFNLAIVVLFFGLVEAYFAWFPAPITKKERVESNNSSFQGPGPYYIHDEIRGYAAASNAKKISKKMVGDKVLYDVVYTTNQYGLRVEPHDLAPSKNSLSNDYKNVVFFGGSFTFGEGVNDNEALPYLLEELSAGKYRAYNFGFHGYGPQQMLRIIETGLLDKVISENKPMIAIYEALIEHIERT